MILVNGAATHALPATDRGLAYGDGVFRTFAVLSGRIPAWNRHYAKLVSDAQALRIACPEMSSLRGEIERCSAGMTDCAVKVMLTRGSGRRGYALPENTLPTRVVMCTPLPDATASRTRRDIRARLCSLRLGWQPALAGIKHLNRLENVLARAEWDDPGIAEGLLQDLAGNVIGGTMSNLFVVEDGNLATPDLSRCGVAGVTRDRIMASAKQHGVHCEVASIGVDRLLSAQEVMLVNSLIGVWQVRQIGDRQWAPGAASARVRQWLDECDD